jgi:hypothetical protein
MVGAAKAADDMRMLESAVSRFIPFPCALSLPGPAPGLVVKAAVPARRRVRLLAAHPDLAAISSQ